MLTVGDTTANQKLSALQALWEQKRAERAMPRRNEFSVTELRPWLGHLALIDLGEKDDTFRLCGINLFQRFGADVTGFSTRDLRVENGRFLRDCIARMRKTALPSPSNHAQIIHGENVTFDELALPLADDGTLISVVLFASYPATTKAAW